MEQTCGCVGTTGISSVAKLVCTDKSGAVKHHSVRKREMEYSTTRSGPCGSWHVPVLHMGHGVAQVVGNANWSCSRWAWECKCTPVVELVFTLLLDVAEDAGDVHMHKRLSVASDNVTSIRVCEKTDITGMCSAQQGCGHVAWSGEQGHHVG